MKWKQLKYLYRILIEQNINKRENNRKNWWHRHQNQTQSRICQRLQLSNLKRRKHQETSFPFLQSKNNL